MRSEDREDLIEDLVDWEYRSAEYDLKARVDCFEDNLRNMADWELANFAVQHGFMTPESAQLIYNLEEE